MNADSAHPTGPLRIKAIAAASLLAAAWLLEAAALITHPLPEGSGLAGQMAIAAAHPNELLLFAVLYQLSAIFIVPAMILVAWLASGRGAWLIFAAAVVMLVGALGHAGESAMKIAFVAAASIPGDQGEAVTAFTKLGPYVGPILVLAAISDLGLLLLGAAMWRARLTPPWPLALLLVGTIGGSVAPVSKLTIALTLAVATIGVLWICAGLVRVGGGLRNNAATAVRATSSPSR